MEGEVKLGGRPCPGCGGTAVPFVRVRPEAGEAPLPPGGVPTGEYVCVSCGRRFFPGD